MKKTELTKLVRECVREVIQEEEAAAQSAIPKSVDTAEKKVTDLNKLVKQLPDELKAKLAKKIKAAQGDITSFKADATKEEPKKDK